MLWMGLACFAICIFSSGFLFGAVIGAKGAEKRALTKIAVAENRAEYWYDEADRYVKSVRELRAKLEACPAPRQRDANGRFVK